MSFPKLFRALSVASVFCLALSAASAREILAEWNFNSITEESVTNGVNEVFDADAGGGWVLHPANASVSDANGNRASGTLLSHFY